MTPRFSIYLDDVGVEKMVRNATAVLRDIIEPAARELAKYAADAGREVTPKLGAEWHVNGSGETMRHVSAPEWWAHFFAGGTKAHGPRSAALMSFVLEGNNIRTGFVRGITATHFDKKAVDRAKPRIEEIIARAIQEGADA